MSETGTIGYAVNCSILFQELPLLQRPAAARAAGFAAIELWWPFAHAVSSEREIADLLDAIGSAGVELIAMNTFAGDMAAGERGIASNPNRVSEFRQNIEVVSDIARRTGCRLFNVLYGNRVEGVEDASAQTVAIENLVFAANTLAAGAGTVLVEALSGVDSYPLKHAQEAVAVVNTVRDAGARNIAFLFDSFHLAANGADPLADLEEHAASIGHVQIADCPGRGAPGTGSLDFAALLRRIRALRGQSWISLEYLAPPDTDRFGWLATSSRDWATNGRSTSGPSR
jgi:hydroxypyruvate isomerase